MTLERRRIQSSDLMLSLVTLRIWFVWSILVTSGIQRNCRRKRNLNIQPQCTVQEITPTSFRKHRQGLSTRHQKKNKGQHFYWRSSMFSQRTGSFEELGWQEFELGKGWYEHWPRAKTGTGQRPRWCVWLPVSLQCRRQKQWGCRGMMGSIADYCQNWKRMITKPEAPEKLLVTSQLWHSKGKVKATTTIFSKSKEKKQCYYLILFQHCFSVSLQSFRSKWQEQSSRQTDHLQGIWGMTLRYNFISRRHLCFYFLSWFLLWCAFIFKMWILQVIRYRSTGHGCAALTHISYVSIVRNFFGP